MNDVLTEEEIVFRIFASAHPHEAHELDPEQFWEVFQEEYPGVERETMERLLGEGLEGE